MDQTNQPLSKTERRKLKKEKQRQEQQRMHRKSQRKKTLVTLSWILGAVVVVLAIILFIANKKSLPPTIIEGHIEVSPPAHFLTQPMDIRVHKHMLEHADGSGPPGVIINYDCENFDCPADLLENLRKIVDQYPENVYVAPYRNMKSMLVLTRLGEQETLKEFDETRIEKFIEN